jgi:hypothetical protein
MRMYLLIAISFLCLGYFLRDIHLKNSEVIINSGEIISKRYICDEDYKKTYLLTIRQKINNSYYERIVNTNQENYNRYHIGDTFKVEEKPTD